jgi:hypothetical protein
LEEQRKNNDDDDESKSKGKGKKRKLDNLMEVCIFVSDFFNDHS